MSKKIALVTGGTGGIGTAILEILCKNRPAPPSKPID